MEQTDVLPFKASLSEQKPISAQMLIQMPLARDWATNDLQAWLVIECHSTKNLSHEE
jgi:hypothetical protein|tara:strand:+ start:140 stop:310 length:171 start_codon:yes stop_codon:yes gene_type:complete